VPGCLDDLQETITPGLKRQKMKYLLMRGCCGSVQQERRMIRAERRKGLHLMRGEQELLVHRDECSIDSFQSWVLTFIALSIEPPIQMDFLQRSLIEKAPKLPHLHPIKQIIALVSDLNGLTWIQHHNITTQFKDNKLIMVDLISSVTIQYNIQLPSMSVQQYILYNVVNHNGTPTPVYFSLPNANVFFSIVTNPWIQFGPGVRNGWHWAL
jgi:hypothetical protein